MTDEEKKAWEMLVGAAKRNNIGDGLPKWISAVLAADAELTALRAEVERLHGIPDDGSFHAKLGKEGFGVTERMAICRVLRAYDEGKEG